jgi:hypothetical protein
VSAFLRHTPTGDLYPYHESLARRDDMVEFVAEAEEVAPAAPKATRRPRAPKAAAPAEIAELSIDMTSVEPDEPQ